ncbi:hypothetical protein AVEN_244667-1 [Araneus ventricosus]|uniref:Uncharacterized protein n=1 Tax=Araneus ventricosus TaxID=182803 RepID=A0A4Y2KGY3_ARAVE|nr:hypothetical protein AVEN_244667-1 [Araneus ventricosus]
MRKYSVSWICETKEYKLRNICTPNSVQLLYWNKDASRTCLEYPISTLGDILLQEITSPPPGGRNSGRNVELGERPTLGDGRKRNGSLP